MKPVSMGGNKVIERAISLSQSKKRTVRPSQTCAIILKLVDETSAQHGC